MTKIKELFSVDTELDNINWSEIIDKQYCPYINKKCLKNRKSQAEISIGTCTLEYKKDNVIICPHRLLQNKQIFMDCIGLLKGHVPGNQMHIVSEISIPGGNVDYFLVSTRDNKVKDFVGIELQTLDTTGTVWPEREKFLKHIGYRNFDSEAVESSKKFGMNWKMTAKTILVQLHHKINTFEHLNKHLVLVIQEPLLRYMRNEFDFSEVREATLNDSLHIHTYDLEKKQGLFSLDFKSNLSTDSNGMAICLGLQAEAKVELEDLIRKIEAKLSNNTLFTII